MRNTFTLSLIVLVWICNTEVYAQNPTTNGQFMCPGEYFPLPDAELVIAEPNSNPSGGGTRVFKASPGQTIRVTVLLADYDEFIGCDGEVSLAIIPQSWKIEGSIVNTISNQGLSFSKMNPNILSLNPQPLPYEPKLRINGFGLTFNIFVSQNWLGDLCTASFTLKDGRDVSSIKPVGKNTGSIADPDLTFSFQIQGFSECPADVTFTDYPPIPLRNSGVWYQEDPNIFNSVIYAYEGIPNDPSLPQYENTLFAESFVDLMPQGIDYPDDIKDIWLIEHPDVMDANDVAMELFTFPLPTAFYFENNDKFLDQHSWFWDSEEILEAFKDSAYEDSDGVGFSMIQTYMCAGSSIGVYDLFYRRLDNSSGDRINQVKKIKQ